MNPQQSIHQTSLKRIFDSVISGLSIRSLTTAIRDHCVKTNQSHLKQSYLTFFLRCEKYIKHQSDSEWKRIFNKQFYCLNVLFKLDVFLTQKLQTVAMSNLKKQFSQKHHIHELLQSCNHIIISEDVRIKTKSFFAWCQYLNIVKEYRKYKSMQHQHKSIAQKYSLRSVKEKYFYQWKQSIQNNKNQRKKQSILQETKKIKMLQFIFDQFNQKIQISKIQQTLVYKIQEIMKKFKKIQCYRIMKASIKRDKALQNNKKQAYNIWVYRFYKLLQTKGKRIQTKMWKILQLQHEQKYSIVCSKIAFYFLKNQIKLKNDLINQLKQNLIRSSLRRLIKSLKMNRTNKMKIRFVEQLLIKQNLKYIFVNSFNQYLKQKQCFKKQQIIIQKYEFNKQLQAFSTWKRNKLQKQRNQQKSTKINQLQTFYSKRKLLSNIKQEKNKKKIINVNVLLFSQAFQRRHILKQIKKYHLHQLEKKNTNLTLKKNYNRNLIRCAFKGWKQFKQIVKTQETYLFESAQIIEKYFLKTAVRLLKQRSQLYFKTQNIKNCLNNVFQKMMFQHFFQKVNERKNRIKKFEHKIKQKSSLFLFNVFKNIITTKKQNFYQITIIFSKIQKIQFIKKVQQNYKQVRQINTLKYLKSNAYKINFLQMLLSFKKQSLKICTKNKIYTKQTRIIAFKYLQTRINDFRNKKKQIINQQRQIFCLKISNKLQTFKKHILLNIQKKEFESNVQNAINYILLKKVLKNGLYNSKMIQKHKNYLIKQKKQYIFANYCKQFLKLLKYVSSQSKTNRLIQNYQKKKSFQFLINNTEINNKCNKLLAIKALLNKYYSIKVLMKQTQYDRIRRQQKSEKLKQKIRQQSEVDCKKELFCWMQRYNNIKKGEKEAKRLCLFNALGIFLRNVFAQRYYKIKTFIGIRHYARRLKRTVLQSMAIAVNEQVTKQNRSKTEQSSIARMQRSLDKNRKKMKLSEAIDRFNMRNSKML